MRARAAMNNPIRPASGAAAASTPRHHHTTRAAPKGGLDVGAGDEIRTRDIYLGKVVLYQLSYSRVRKKARSELQTFYLR